MLNSFSLSAARVWPDGRAWDLRGCGHVGRGRCLPPTSHYFPLSASDRERRGRDQQEGQRVPVSLPMHGGLTWGSLLSRLREMAPDPQPTSKMRGLLSAPTTRGPWVTSSSTHSTSSCKADRSQSWC